MVYLKILLMIGAILGPVKADVVKVVDGDTIKVNAHVWNDVYIKTSVRVLGVDTPELRGKCPEEKVRAKAAKQFVIEMINSRPVYLKNVRSDKYGGRVLGNVFLQDGRELSKLLIQYNHGREYNGGKRKSWCK